MRVRPRRYYAAPLLAVVARSGVACGARARAVLRAHCCVIVARIRQFGQFRTFLVCELRRRMRPRRCAAPRKAADAQSDGAISRSRSRSRRRALPHVTVRYRRDKAIGALLHVPCLLSRALRAAGVRRGAVLVRYACAAARSAASVALAVAPARTRLRRRGERGEKSSRG